MEQEPKIEQEKTQSVELAESEWDAILESLKVATSASSMPLKKVQQYWELQDKVRSKLGMEPINRTKEL